VAQTSQDSESPNKSPEPDSSDSINLELPLVITETTIAGVTNSSTNAISSFHISSDGDLIGEGRVIDKNVRSFTGRKSPLATLVFYIKDDNTLWGYGANGNGILGDGTGVDRNEPVHILDNVATVYLTIPAGSGAIVDRVFAITTDRKLMTWGDGDFEPKFVADEIISVYGSIIFLVAQHSSGRLYTWHNGNLSELPVEPVFYIHWQVHLPGWVYHYINAERQLVRRFSTPATMQESDRTSVVATDVYKMFIIPNNTDEINILFTKNDGTLWGLGSNRNGELGDGTRVPRETPVHIADNVVSVIRHSFLKSDGTLWRWSSADPTPILIEEGVAILTGDGVVHYQDGRAKDRSGRTLENVMIPRTLTFDALD